MAVEYCAENPTSRGVSPRISFSHDLCKYDVVPIEPHLPFNSSSTNFNFPNSRQPLNSYSSADELFSNGVLLPLQQDKIFKPPPPPPSPPSPPPTVKTSTSTSFWKFKRSRSFNCSSIYKGSLCPLQILSRSKSTGSNSSSSKRSLVPKDDHNRKQKASYQKPPLKKTYASNSPTGVTVSPVLNVSSGNLFGLGTLFSKGAGGGGGGDKIYKKKLNY